MRINYCDICQELIKKGDKKILLGINSTIEKNSDNEVNETMTQEEIKKAIQSYQSEYKAIKIYEICNSCKELIERLLTLRRQEIKKIKDELDKAWGNSNGNNTVI